MAVSLRKAMSDLRLYLARAQDNVEIVQTVTGLQAVRYIQ